MEIVRGEFLRFEQWESELNLGHFEQGIRNTTTLE